MTKANIKIAPSSVINYGGLDCIVLDVERDKILVLAKESIGNMPFDEGNSKEMQSISFRNSIRLRLRLLSIICIRRCLPFAVCLTETAVALRVIPGRRLLCVMVGLPPKRERKILS